jgi:hypothetical protein
LTLSQTNDILENADIEIVVGTRSVKLFIAQQWRSRKVRVVVDYFSVRPRPYSPRRVETLMPLRTRRHFCRPCAVRPTAPFLSNALARSSRAEKSASSTSLS